MSAAIISELLARGDISAELRQELEEFAVAAAAGQLDPDDAEYVAALARRLGTGGASSPDGVAAPREPSLAEWRARALAAEARIAELEADLARRG